MTSGTLTLSRTASARNASTRLRGSETPTDTDLSVTSSGGRPRRNEAPDIARLSSHATPARFPGRGGYAPSNRCKTFVPKKPSRPFA